MWIKICGIRDTKTADEIATLEIDAIGLNFYAKSPRFVDVETAVQISQLLPATIARVGLFVNHSLDEIEQISARCPLDYLQLHGDEPPSFLADLKRRHPDAQLIRACRIDSSGLDRVRNYLTECRRLGCELAACLVDAHVPGVYGGSGTTVPWDLLCRDDTRELWPPLILAGGLNAQNVAQAISAVRPWGVDVASGVESMPGVKDLKLVQDFVRSARRVSANQQFK